METKVTNIERIARIFNLKADDELLVLKIGDVVQAKDKAYKKKDFCNAMLKAKNDKLQAEIHNLKNEFAESIGITEHMMVKQSRDVLRKELNKSLEETHRLRSSIERYREREFKDRLKSIVK
jgi:hypothetical protein